jgi:hypothetical protein
MVGATARFHRDNAGWQLKPHRMLRDALIGALAPQSGVTPAPNENKIPITATITV